MFLKGLADHSVQQRVAWGDVVRCRVLVFMGALETDALVFAGNGPAEARDLVMVKDGCWYARDFPAAFLSLVGATAEALEGFKEKFA